MNWELSTRSFHWCGYLKVMFKNNLMTLSCRFAFIPRTGIGLHKTEFFSVMYQVYYFFSPPPFGEGLYSFTRVRMSVYMYVCCRRRSEDADRILKLFNAWNWREISPWWRLGGSKSYQSSSLRVIQEKCEYKLHYCLYRSTGILLMWNTDQSYFLLLLFPLLLNVFLRNHILWGGLFNRGLNFV